LFQGELEIFFCHRNTKLGFQFHPFGRGTPPEGVKLPCCTYNLNLHIIN
jgi:hypothetical protein